MLAKRSISLVSKYQVIIRPSRCLCSEVVQYKLKEERLNQIAKSPSGWVPPADNPPDVGFGIRRTRTNNLPVYTHYSHSGTRAVTVIRKVSGDLKELEKCLRFKLGDEKTYQINEITSCVKVKGKHKKEVAKWLLQMGF
ncbi:large ribosomal subunit protein mL49-like [Rhopilema esculentum]|uniref:large ribosomal subunit protein mL49-like n=1 Tax=Rhopilema esculentum TaxID=499914 RepID=UPI0031D03BDE